MLFFGDGGKPVGVEGALAFGDKGQFQVDFLAVLLDDGVPVAEKVTDLNDLKIFRFEALFGKNIVEVKFVCVGFYQFHVLSIACFLRSVKKNDKKVYIK